MKTANVSFCKIFDIQYQRFDPALNDKAEKRFRKDFEALNAKAGADNKDVRIEPIHIRGSRSIYPRGIRIFTEESYEEYMLLRTVSPGAASEFADNEAKTKTFTVIV